MLSKSTLATALETVTALDHDLTMAIGHEVVLAAHTYSAARALWELRRSLERSLTRTRGLREELLGVTAVASQHSHEAALRERTVAIVARLADLALAESEASANDLYAGRFRRLVDVSTHLLERIGSVNEACFRAHIATEGWRDDEGHPDRATRRELYRVALLSARETLLAIGKDEDLASFLRVGATVRSEPFRLACRSVATLLELPLEADQLGADLDANERGL